MIEVRNLRVTVVGKRMEKRYIGERNIRCRADERAGSEPGTSGGGGGNRVAAAWELIKNVILGLVLLLIWRKGVLRS